MADEVTCEGKHHVFPDTATGTRCRCGDYEVQDTRGMRRRHKPMPELVREMKHKIRFKNAN